MARVSFSDLEERLGKLESAHDELDRRMLEREMISIEKIGRDGRGGEFADMKARLLLVEDDASRNRIFRTKLVTLASVAVPVIGFLAALASHGLSRLFGW